MERSEFDGRLYGQYTEQIFVCAAAQQKFLQDEFSTFDGNMAKLFRQLQKNTSVFHPSALAKLQSAAAISVDSGGPAWRMSEI